MAIKLDTDIPLPPRRRSGRNKSEVRVAMETMNVGESFAQPAKRYAYLNSTASLIAKAAGRKFSMRKLSAAECRVWRIA